MRLNLRRLLVSIAVLSTCAAAAQTPPEIPPPGQVLTTPEPEVIVPQDARPAVPIANDERIAIEIVSINLDLHLTPADAKEEAHATLTVHNRSNSALERFPLQLSSTLHWISASAATSAGLKPIAFTQSPITTDADHTGYAQEAIFTPAAPLGAGESMTLSVFYGGEIKQASDRLEFIGAPKEKAAASDWDAIMPTSDTSATALRGFGNVLWYPVAAPTAIFGDGNQLFDLIARERLRNTAVAMHLRLTVEYTGDPPDAAIFDGQLQPLLKAPDADDQVIDETHGIATADFPLAPIGARTPNLFLTAQQAVTTENELLTIVTPQAAREPYAAAVTSLAPVLSGLLGPTPRIPLLLLDHPGAPFEDAGFIAAQLSSSAEPKLIAPEIVRGLTHAWLNPQSRPTPACSLWIEDGLAEFMALVWTERADGREAAVGELRHASVLIALADGTGDPQPLTAAHADAFLRLKSAFVFWQLRELLGDKPFSEALTAYRHSLALNPKFDFDPKALQQTFEKVSSLDLGWFFSDWVYADKGLPDLSIVQASPHPLPVRAGKSAGYIVAVEVRNDGDAIADVPVTVRAGALSASERLRIPAHASASTRVVFESKPESIEVNDGSVPEQRTTTHTLILDQPAP
jgi:hypothetical protein